MTTFFGKPFLQLAIVAASLSIFIQSSAPAGMLVNFDNSVDGGTISYDGIGGTLIGTDILF